MAKVDGLPSHMRSVPGSVNIPTATFPSSIASDKPDPDSVASDIVEAFNKHLDAQDNKGLATLFADDGFWRDHLALSWSFRTLRGHQEIQNFLDKCRSSNANLVFSEIELDKSTAARSPQLSFLDAEQKVPCLAFCFTLQTTKGNSEGVARLIQVAPGTWKIYTLFTTLLRLNGHEESIYHRRPRGVQHGGQPGRKNWRESRTSEALYEGGREPQVMILGMLDNST